MKKQKILSSITDFALSLLSVCCPVTSTSAELYSIKGDANADGMFDVADLVLLQKWLLSVLDANFENWQAVDFCKDGEFDIFDLALAKRELTEKSNSELIDSPNCKAAAFACADDELYEGFIELYRQIKGDAQLLFDKKNNTVWIVW